MQQFFTNKMDCDPLAEGTSHASFYLERGEKILKRVNELAAISETETGIRRTFGTPAFIEGCKRVAFWMKQAGLVTRVDNAGNVRGRLNSLHPGAKTLVIASHTDTVVNAGKFDGPLGVILGIDAVENLVTKKISLPYHIELIAFCDEEGVRFHTTYLGSRVVAGTFPGELLSIKDEQGVSLQEVISGMGGNVADLANDAIPREEWLGYYEVHIEQGPVLHECKVPVAVVTAIAGQHRAEIIFTGMAGHAGTVPMDMRYDALCAAAEFITETEKFARQYKKQLVATVGKLAIDSPASNVIPGVVVCSLDIRSQDEELLSSACSTVREICAGICSRRNLDFSWEIIQEMPPVQCDPTMVLKLKQAVFDRGIEVVEIASGAGHDAVPVSAVAPVAMLFVRCYKGISHNPLENVEINDIASAIEVTDSYLQQLVSIA